ncbi:unnamed protein product [Prorocentrum cordatum]|uniref:DUF8003 domain-containing protein n=1 Tax=Prorocentrum cordatum TaxID=2364126 RepID=A0ABN9UV75_9DINO|nr:unnamed protein product [Polarella glacialis]
MAALLAYFTLQQRLVAMHTWSHPPPHWRCPWQDAVHGISAWPRAEGYAPLHPSAALERGVGPRRCRTQAELLRHAAQTTLAPLGGLSLRALGWAAGAQQWRVQVDAVAVERSCGALGKAAAAMMQGIRGHFEDTHLLDQSVCACGVFDGQMRHRWVERIGAADPARGNSPLHEFLSQVNPDLLSEGSLRELAKTRARALPRHGAAGRGRGGAMGGRIASALLAAGLASAACAWPLRRGLCDRMEANTCVVTSNRTVSRSLLLRHRGNVEFRNVRWQCVVSKGSPESLRIDIAVDGTISVVKSSLLHCATIVLEAKKSVRISDSSEVSANGTSFYGEPAPEKDPLALGWSATRRGASHGGLGGSAQGCATDDAQLLRRLPLAHGEPLAPWSMGRAGVAALRGAGGGRVRIATQGPFVLNGTVSTAGAGPEGAGGEERDDVAAGSGGSIWVTCESLVQPGAVAVETRASQGNISGDVDFVDLGRDAGSGDAAGGDVLARSGRIVAAGGSCAGCLCGGGGRVLVEVFEGPAPRHVLVSGGCWRAAATEVDSVAPASGCACGSAGPWVLRRQPRPKKSTGDFGWLGLPSGVPRGLQHRKILKKPGQVEGATITVFVDNSHAVDLAGSKLSQPTPLAAVFGAPVALQLHDAVVVPAEERPEWDLTSLRLISDTIGSALRHLAPSPLVLRFPPQNDGIELALSSTLQASELQIAGAREVILRRSAAIDAAVASIRAEETIDTHLGTLGQEGGGAIGLWARRVVLGGGRLRRARVSAELELTVKRGSRLLTSHRRCDQLPAPLHDPCEEQLRSGPWRAGEAAPSWGNRSDVKNVTFDIVLVATNGSIVVEGEAEVHAAALLLCAAGNLTVSGLVSARGLGCPPNRGQSSGAAPEVGHHSGPSLKHSSARRACGGGGGAHCGDGGHGAHNNTRAVCSGTGGQKYDGWWARDAATDSALPSHLPTWSASGGGGASGGAGGGIIWARAAVLELASNSTSISADGDAAVSLQDGSWEGAGGGAGGSVIINASVVVGAGRVEARGGRGGGCIGGGGGGGAIGGACLDASTAWSGFQGGLSVEGGGHDGSPACLRQSGIRAQRGGEGELLQLAACRPGREGIFCAECNPGFFNPEKEPNSTEARYRLCRPCANKPVHADYTSKGWLNKSCPYVCPGGYPPVEVNPLCDDPWTYYFAFFGGVRGVALRTLTAALLFGLSLSAAQVQRRKRLQWLRKQQQSGHLAHGVTDEMLLLFQSVSGPHPLADINRGGPGQPSYRASRSSLVRRLFKPAFMSRSRGAASQPHLLSVGDLPYHVARIYLLGDNTPSDPWRLCQKPPDALKHLIDPSRWEAFAAQVTQMCRKRMRSQRAVEGVLRWLYLPLAEHVRHRLRVARAAGVASYVWSRSENTSPGDTFWRLTSGINSSSLGLKFGTDRRITLGFVDVLDYGRNKQDWQVKPPVPMVIAAAGDGKYTAPYQLDYLDPLVQSVSQYVGRRVWHQVLLAFNLLARLLPSSPSEEDAKLLRRSLARVSAEVMQQTDLECHAVLFWAPAEGPPAEGAPRGGRGGVSRQSSVEAILGGSSLGSWAPPGDPGSSPLGSQTPVTQPESPLDAQCLCRPALVLSQRPGADRPGLRGRALTSTMARGGPRLRRSVRLDAGGLCSRVEEPLLRTAEESPMLGFSQEPANASELLFGPLEGPPLGAEAGWDGLQPLSLPKAESRDNLELNAGSNRWHVIAGAAQAESRHMPYFSEASGVSSPVPDEDPFGPRRSDSREPLLGPRGGRRRRRCCSWAALRRGTWEDAEAGLR